VSSEVGVATEWWGWRLAQDSDLQGHIRNIKPKKIHLPDAKSSDARCCLHTISHLEGMTLLIRSEMKIQTHRLTHDVRSGELSRGRQLCAKRAAIDQWGVVKIFSQRLIGEIGGAERRGRSVPSSLCRDLECMASFGPPSKRR
jgi:hypothetical protein